MVLRLTSCPPRRSGFLVTVASRISARPPGRARAPPQDLTPASRRQDHTTSPSAAAPFVCAHRDRSRKSALRSPCARALPRPPHPAPTFVTMAKRPSEGRDGESYRFDLGFGKTEIFFQKGLDRQQHQPSLICPTGKEFDPFQEFFALRLHASCRHPRKRVTRYSRGGGDRIEKPRRTGSPAGACHRARICATRWRTMTIGGYRATGNRTRSVLLFCA
jgi:hypothetical protein